MSRLLNPMTLIVVLVLVGLLATGVAMILGAIKDSRTRGASKLCSRCHVGNPAHARFCSRCGQVLP